MSKLLDWLGYALCCLADLLPPCRLQYLLIELVPDKCEVMGCRGHGVRGNENVIDGVIVCDDCYLRQSEKGS